MKVQLILIIAISGNNLYCTPSVSINVTVYYIEIVHSCNVDIITNRKCANEVQ